MFGKVIVRGLLVVAMVLATSIAQGDHAAWPTDWNNWSDPALMVTVGNAGNTADSTGYGSVGYAYNIGKYDVTVGQYVRFLNAVAKTDTYGLYSPYMATGTPIPIGIAQSGSSGSYSYSVTGGYSQAANCPVFDVSWGDAARFSNWLQNGQPTTGVEDLSTTEDGSYYLNGKTSAADLMTITRKANATYVIPSENEWYKAAYYDPTLNGGAGGYWTYPTKSNTAPGNTLPDGGNSANYDNGRCTDPTNFLTPVGAFVASPGPYGTFDMGGDVYQWNEADISGEYRGWRGGSWLDVDYFALASFARNAELPTSDDNYFVGFRVASVPEPGSLVLLAGVALAALLCWWRKRA